ncbi:hydroxyacid dehydrogenase [Natronoglomus mannanivorans]|uniref:Hydroxyacid dehydrogenase n=1 Tax=Natronoglomus mannanivorans TaxID=2979990 RepID=A0AAP2Z173_9EURY|nr:hydroxyacid dehydrogenase [Halobacteria archaeon AArc-xg1-1]
MRILVTYPDVPRRDFLFSADVVARLESLGDVDWNERTDQFTPVELSDRLRDVDVCVTGWGCPTLSADVLDGADAGDGTRDRDGADALELVTHVGGSVASVASPALYERGIPVCSANHVMAPFVAEGILAYALAGLRDVVGFDAALADGEWPDGMARSESLFGAKIGFVGLGSVGRELLALLEPFEPTVDVYDPYVAEDELADFEFAALTDLETALSSELVSVHASKTPETIHLLDGEALATVPDGGLLVNAARGAIVDEAALVAELETGRISAALDVYETEPLPDSSPLRDLDNAVLGPHVAGAPTRHRLAEAAVEEVERFAAGESLQHDVPRERYELMTRDWLEAS